MMAAPPRMPSAFIFQAAGNANTAEHNSIVTLTALQPSSISTAKPPGERRMAPCRVACPPQMVMIMCDSATKPCVKCRSMCWTGGVSSAAIPNTKQLKKMRANLKGRILRPAVGTFNRELVFTFYSCWSAYAARRRSHTTTPISTMPARINTGVVVAGTACAEGGAGALTFDTS